ncbi:MAG: hypothetical protein C5B53_10255 [Candidatus Melainabacteria bacterium]|nr:MAG: hypothetical protein C5B53_10255 [Candidatus Melainabacteria bacterium]
MKERKPVIEKEVGDGWSLYETYIGDHPAFIRLREGIGNLIGRKGRTLRVRVAWGYGPENSGEMPTPDQMHSMEECENLLVEALEGKEFGLLTNSSLCDGLRIWCFYCKDDIEELNKRIQRTLPHDEPFPIEFDCEEDAGWNEYCNAWAHCQPAPN